MDILNDAALHALVGSSERCLCYMDSFSNIIICGYVMVYEAHLLLTSSASTGMKFSPRDSVNVMNMRLDSNGPHLQGPKQMSIVIN